MTPTQILTLGGTVASIVAALVVVLAAARTSAAKVWREEAEAQTARANRLEYSLKEINERLSRIEAENKRLIALLTSLDPERLAVIRLTSIPTED
ncbi:MULTISPECIES: hypothetical protein [unclassified Streptomyces]|uniref:hypothetical protein n=1 Tax=unclassified Streptomyces TaxID=2593676 RepID=UPI0035D87AC5